MGTGSEGWSQPLSGAPLAGRTLESELLSLLLARGEQGLHLNSHAFGLEIDLLRAVIVLLGD
ncbi:hypothetical protein ASG57_31905 [Bradyrhizobium sp. Leaf396]|nr:hypothetical protein ASG57_31905 [Bradyrhizobium sp. Leaf396]